MANSICASYYAARCGRNGINHKMIGQTWESEIREFQDEKTGRKIKQLTSTGNNVHLYFTENSFDLNKNEIIFQSDRASGEDKAPHENPNYAIFRMNLDTGEMCQLTDSRGDRQGTTKTPDSSLIVYVDGNKICKLDAETGKSIAIYEETGPFNLGA